MQIEISNPRYIELMVDRCNNAKAIESELLGHKYLMNRVHNYAVSEANKVYGDIGILNISKKNKRLFERMVDKCVREQIMKDIHMQIELEDTFLLKK